MKDTSSVIFEPELIKRYDKSGPRYTSYPTAVQFHQEFDDTAYKAQAELSNASNNPLSLYFHIPFCDTVCYYCGCNKVVTKDRSRAAPYLQRLHKEIAMQAQLFANERVVDQLHWGGGTPTFISHDEMRELMQVTRQHFKLHDDDSGEYSIEIDPREVSRETITILRELGFNRMSLGVQDFEPAVQKAVNRIQSEAETLGAINAAREEGFKSVSVDLIYGLPHQSVESFHRTLDKIIDVDPDRLSIFNYAHLPEMFKPQRRIAVEDLPSPEEKLEILKQTIHRLTEAGYVYIGMDHFAKPEDELAIAQSKGTLYRNFQGYSTHADCDMIGLGVTSIGQVANGYAQNVKTMDEYYQRIDANTLPVYRGYELNTDDILRREIITQLICHFSLNFSKINQQFGVEFVDYFSIELDELSSMAADGLLSVSAQKIQVAPAGKLLIRNICMVFDKYLRNKQQQRFSKVI
ncbi:MAG: oxygen-independent coproporphyrinogen III oxidase [Gammaproteobacteria bacterium]|nr:oxygen-independent coproporphyrinogen III oxidase [Gammaproteobacteria bacterium]